MLMYWLLFAIAAVLAIQQVQADRAVWLLLATLLGTVIGLRYQVGGDWGAYLRHFEDDARSGLGNILLGKEPGFHALNHVVSALGIGAWLVNWVCGLLFALGLVRFCRQQPDPFLALAVAVPYMVIVVGMGYQRQAVALGFFMWGLADLERQRYARFVPAVALGALFHQTVLIVLPLAALANTRNRWWSALWVGLVGGMLYQFNLADNTDALWANYVTSGYSSEGGLIRVFMNALAAAVLLVWRKQLVDSERDQALWGWFALFCLVLLPLVPLASTAVDRVALYFMPVQLWVWSRFPRLFPPTQKSAVSLAVLVAYGAVQAVWLVFAANSIYWLPYQFWPLAWLQTWQ
jgi:EpsG family